VNRPIVSTLVAGLILVAGTSQAQAAPDASVRALLAASELKAHALEQALARQTAAGAATSKEFTSGCVGFPLPTQPTGPTWSTRYVSDQGGEVELTAWRVPCSGANDAQLVVKATPLSGTPFSPCQATMVQNGVQYTSLLRTSDPGAVITHLCNTLYVPTSFYLISTGLTPAFDDDQASTLYFRVSGTLEGVRLDVPAFNPADYTATPPPSSLTVKRQMAGAWNTDTIGNQGFFFDVDEPSRILAVAWFTGTTDGRALDWYSAVGNYTGPNVQLTVYRTTGVAFARPTPVNTVPFGSMTINFSACDRATARWQLDDGRTGELPIQKLLAVVPAC